MRPVALIAALLALLVLAPVAGATLPGKNGRIAFSAEGRDGAGGGGEYTALITTRPDSRGDRFVGGCQPSAESEDEGDCSISYRSPAWSPDGRRLAFDAGRSIALVSSSGAGLRTLGAVSSNDGNPTFSPDGRRLAIDVRAATARAIFVRPLSGAGEARIAKGSDPDWGRGGNIAFERAGAVWRIRGSGGSARRLGRGRDPSWAPSGRSLAFVRRGGLFVSRSDGRGVRRVTRCSGCRNPAFSPDGAMIAYQDRGIRLVRVRDGRRAASLVENSSAISAFEPAWQPLR